MKQLKFLILIGGLAMMVILVSFSFWYFMLRDGRVIDTVKTELRDSGIIESTTSTQEGEGMAGETPVGEAMPLVCGDGILHADEECDPAAVVTGCSFFEKCSDSCVCEERTDMPTAPEEETKEVVCGDGKCEDNEDEDNCCTDCGCPSGKYCKKNKCEYPYCEDDLDCDDDDICTIDSCVSPNKPGSYCLNDPIRQCVSGDLCCPAGCYASRVGGDSDCSPKCGNRVCEINENCGNCAADCGCDENQHCAPEESGAFVNGCVTDWNCGDGVCTTEFENCGSCADDCGCGVDRVCAPGKTGSDSRGCYLPPEPFCGDSTCDPDNEEDCLTCSSDCGCATFWYCDPGPGANSVGCVFSGVVCGDGLCESGKGELCSNCATDCGCVAPEICSPGAYQADPKGCWLNQ